MDMNNITVLQTRFGIGVATSAEDAAAMEVFAAQMSLKLGYISLREYNTWLESKHNKQIEGGRLAITM